MEVTLAKCGYMQITNRQILLTAAAVILASFAIRPVMAAEEPSLEYKVKAAFIYNFLKFVEWPEDASPELSTPITIGIVGEDKFGTAFNEITSRKVKDRSIVIKRFADITSDDTKAALAKCHLVFISASQSQHGKEITRLLVKQPVLTVGESDRFLEAGGDVNFIMQEGKVCFEINADNVEASNLKIASQLLRLAKRVIKDGKVKTSNATDMLFRQMRGA
jgi:hypothetical protein